MIRIRHVIAAVMTALTLEGFRKQRKATTPQLPAPAAEQESLPPVIPEFIPDEVLAESQVPAPKSLVMKDESTELLQPMPIEYRYLFNLVRHRLTQNGIDRGMPTLGPMPDISVWSPRLRKIIDENFPRQFKDENHRDEAAMILLIALTPYTYPHLFDDAIGGKLDHSVFPRIGGVHGKNFRGFLPTGETALFLIGNNNYDKRLIVQDLFSAEVLFSKKKIVWLEELPNGEPPMQGRINMSHDYVDTCMYGEFKPPHFSSTFPAKKIETDVVWDDVVLNAELEKQIKDIETWVKFNDKLIREWHMGERYRRGYRALFYGPPGTGKTMTAGLLGKRTNRHVYKIDLSMVVSKYIGETEKNLELVFARAEDKEWILFFDEADALFGKRTNVRDSHDRYANQEVSYLLQRIEQYNGLVLLASNQQAYIDEAFLRRFDAVLKFPIPNADERIKLWQKTFPKDVVFWKKDLVPESGIQPEKIDNIYNLVRKYELSGGSISNVVYYASLKGIEKYEEQKKRLDILNTYTSCPTSYPHAVIFLDDLMSGIQRELVKEGKPFERA